MKRRSTRSREKKSNPGPEAIVDRKTYDRGRRGVGYAHLFMRKSERFVDTLMLRELKVGAGDQGPYVVDSPRHVTSIPLLPLDEMALRAFAIARNAERVAFQDAMRAHGYDASVRKSEHLATIIDIHPIGGRTLIAEVDSAAISAARQNLERIFAEAGVGVPLMHAPHFKVGIADTAADFKNMRAAARDVLVGEAVAVEPIDAYFNRYTEKVRPEHVATPHVVV